MCRVHQRTAEDEYHNRTEIEENCETEVKGLRCSKPYSHREWFVYNKEEWQEFLADYKEEYIISDDNGNACLYIFNIEDKGFYIVSADDRARPILAYSDEGAIDVNNIPSSMNYYLNYFLFLFLLFSLFLPFKSSSYLISSTFLPRRAAICSALLKALSPSNVALTQFTGLFEP